jgi:hypothetical protein
MNYKLKPTYALVTPEDTPDVVIQTAIKEADTAANEWAQSEDIAAYLAGVLAVVGSGASRLNDQLLNEADGLVQDVLDDVFEKHLDEFTVTQLQWTFDANLEMLL